MVCPEIQSSQCSVYCQALRPRSRVPDLLTELTQTRSLLQDKQQQYDELNQKVYSQHY